MELCDKDWRMISILIVELRFNSQILGAVGLPLQSQLMQNVVLRGQLLSHIVGWHSQMLVLALQKA